MVPYALVREQTRVTRENRETWFPVKKLYVGTQYRGREDEEQEHAPVKEAGRRY